MWFTALFSWKTLYTISGTWSKHTREDIITAKVCPTLYFPLDQTSEIIIIKPADPIHVSQSVYSVCQGYFFLYHKDTEQK